jgi:uncharacterized protein
MVSRKAIQKHADAIAREFRPEQMILFGSYAYGRPTADSDVDLMVVMPFRGTGLNQAVRIRTRLGYSGFPMDLLVWKRERLEKRAEEGDVFANDILTRGRVLYENDHS